MIMNGFATESHTVFGRTAYTIDRCGDLKLKLGFDGKTCKIDDAYGLSCA